MALPEEFDNGQATSLSIEDGQGETAERTQSDIGLKEVNPFPLTPTEKRVCKLLLSGMTEGQVANTLSRSPNTIHVHVRSIYRKVRVNNRGDMIRYFQA